MIPCHLKGNSTSLCYVVPCIVLGALLVDVQTEDLIKPEPCKEFVGLW